MSGDKKPPSPQEPSVRDAAIALLKAIEREGEAMCEGTDAYAVALAEQNDAEQALRIALSVTKPRAYEPWSAEAEAWIDVAYRQPVYSRANMIAAYMAGRFAQSRTRPAPIDDIDLALEGIDLIKRSAPPSELRPAHVLAVVNAAEHVLEQHAAFGLRWDADMRAIERWQAGDILPRDARDLFAEVLEYVRHEYPAIQAKIESILVVSAPAGRPLMWPDHADLVVWLLELVHRRPDVPALAEVERVRNRLRTAIVASGGNRLAIDSKAMIDSLVEVALWADRRAYLAETALAQARGEHAGGTNGRLRLVASSDAPIEQHSGCEAAVIGDAGLGSREQTFGGGGAPGPAEGPCGHNPEGQIEPPTPPANHEGANRDHDDD